MMMLSIKKIDFHSRLRFLFEFDPNNDNNEDLEEDSVVVILTDMLLQSAKQDDHLIVEDIRRYAPGPLDFSRQDLIALSIQHARDFDTADYLSARTALGLDANATVVMDTFEQLAEQRWSFAFESDKVHCYTQICFAAIDNFFIF